MTESPEKLSPEMEKLIKISEWLEGRTFTLNKFDQSIVHLSWSWEGKPHRVSGFTVAHAVEMAIAQEAGEGK